jgi:hypothetical protein
MRDFASSPLMSEILSKAMSSEKARRRLQSVRSQLSEMIARKQFNTARAVDAFSAVIHWAVWENLKDHPNGRALYRIAPRIEHGRRACRRVQTAGWRARSASAEKAAEICAGTIASFTRRSKRSRSGRFGASRGRRARSGRSEGGAHLRATLKRVGIFECGHDVFSMRLEAR